MGGSCRFCFFKQRAEWARARAQEWDSQRLPCLAIPYRRVAAEFEALSTREGCCCCVKSGSSESSDGRKRKGRRNSL